MVVSAVNGRSRFSIGDLMDEQACHDFLKEFLHPRGLCCPTNHPLPTDQAPHDRHRAPIVDYRCRTCGSVFNIFTGTLWQKTRYKCSTIVLILHGITEGVPTYRLAIHLGVDRSHLFARRRAIEQLLEQRGVRIIGQHRSR